jgi:choline-sulfatase
MSAQRPNILIVMTDQMAAPLLPLHDPASPIRMPHLQRLARDGVVFDSAYCASPLCAPSRYSFMSGCLPARIGAWDNAADFAADIPTWAHHLRALGYRTALSGKMHFCGPDQLHGFEQRLTSDIYPADYGWVVDWDQPELRPSWYHNMSSVLNAGPCVRSNQLDFDEETAYRAVQYLYDHARGATPRQPFCLAVSMTHPHDPYAIHEEFWNLYRDDEIAQADQDPHSQRLLRVIDLWGHAMPADAIRRARRAYYGACSYVDSILGRLLKTLAECRLAEDTVVIFTGDHGDLLGERGLWYKMHWFEMSARVPLVVHAPQRFAPRRVRESVSTIDLLPTLVELAGGHLEPGITIDGRTLMPHLAGSGGHDEAIGEYTAEGTIDPLMMIRRDRWKLIYSRRDPCLLFDLRADPHERTDLAASAAHREVLDALAAEARQRWDMDAIAARVLSSQRRRRLIAGAQAQGARTSWDHQPIVDAANQYMRNHMDLDDLERRARYPLP